MASVMTNPLINFSGNNSLATGYNSYNSNPFHNSVRHNESGGPNHQGFGPNTNGGQRDGQKNSGRKNRRGKNNNHNAVNMQQPRLNSNQGPARHTGIPQNRLGNNSAANMQLPRQINNMGPEQQTGFPQTGKGGNFPKRNKNRPPMPQGTPRNKGRRGQQTAFGPRVEDVEMVEAPALVDDEPKDVPMFEAPALETAEYRNPLAYEQLVPFMRGSTIYREENIIPEVRLTDAPPRFVYYYYY